MSDMEFPTGLYVDAPHENAPDFVKCKISIDKEKFLRWLEAKETDQYVNLDVKVAKSSGNWYASVDNWKPKPQGQQSTSADPRKHGADDGFDDDIPF